MKTTVLAIIATLLPLNSLAASIPADLKELFNKADQCAHNGGGFIKTYDVKKFSAAEVLKELRDPESFPGGAECLQGRIFSRSKTEAVKLALHHFDKSEYDAECLNEYLTVEEKRELKNVFADKTNVAVFASMFGEGNDYSEGCMTYVFRAYRADGVVIEIQFDHTD